MRIRLASDVHTEMFHNDLGVMMEISFMVLPELPDDRETTLILAGDIGSMRHLECLVAFMNEVAPRFRRVLYNFGNHEYYGGNLETTFDDIKVRLKNLENVFLADNYSQVTTEGRTFHHGTLWTDFNNVDPFTMMEADNRMNDYHLIGCGKRIAEPQDMLARHRFSRALLESNIKEGDIVITHHLPSFRSVPLEYTLAGRINGAYASNLEQMILDKKPYLWMHGHTHNACDHMIGGTRILCNPRGYGNQYEKNGYNNKLVIEV